MARVLLFFLVAYSLDAQAQFSGKVTYQDSYQSKNPNISSSDFEKFMGTKREFYLHGAFYKDVHHGELESVMLYRGDANKLYNYNVGADTIFWMDASGDTLSKVFEIKIEDSNEIVLGQKCKKLTIKSELGTSIYFFSDRLLINPADFKNHHLNFWNLYTSKCKSIPLKIVYEGEEIILTSTAIKIDQMKLEDDVFKIPSGYLKKRF
jgi:hypothetical protein